MQVSAEVRGRVHAKIAECIAIANRAYNIDVKYPTVAFTKCGTTAGVANYKKWSCNFNAALLMDNVEAFLDRTVPHEVAHLVTHIVFPDAHATQRILTPNGFRRSKRDVHGTAWQSVMHTLGADASRCHKYDVSAVKRSKNITKYQYKCNVCGAIVETGGKVHNKIQHGASYHHIGCYGSKLILVNKYVKNNITKQVVTHAPATVHTPAPRVNAGTSKLDRCRSLFAVHGAHRSRKEMIDLFVNMCDCTPLGASTYYATCKKG